MSTKVKRTLSGEPEVWPVLIAALGALGELLLVADRVPAAMRLVEVAEMIGRFSTLATSQERNDWAKRFEYLLQEAGYDYKWEDVEVPSDGSRKS